MTLVPDRARFRPGHALIDRAIIADFSGFTDHHPMPWSMNTRRPIFAPGWIDAGQKAADVVQEAAQPEQVVAPYAMRQTMNQQRSERPDSR